MKNALVNLSFGFGEFDLKKIAISFRKLYVMDVSHFMKDGGRDFSTDFYSKIVESANILEYLAMQEVVELVEWEKVNVDSLEPIFGELLDRPDIECLYTLINDMELKSPDLNNLTNVMPKMNDVLTRAFAQTLKSTDNIDAFPILYSLDSYKNNFPKVDIINFTFNRIPTPHENVHWEQIIEFRNDADVQTKYLELIQWINKVASTSKPMSEIEDEFEYLYNQYMRHYKLHKMKSNMTTMEILILAGIDAFASFNPAGLMKELFSFRKSRVSLLEEELKLPGKEIGYIYKANEVFSPAS